MDDEETRITLRLPSQLRDALKSFADQAGRSMNSEIIARLVDSVYEDDGDAAGFFAKVADPAFVRGIQIGTVEFLIAADDPIEALHDLRKQLQQPLDWGPRKPEAGQ